MYNLINPKTPMYSTFLSFFLFFVTESSASEQESLGIQCHSYNHFSNSRADIVNLNSFLWYLYLSSWELLPSNSNWPTWYKYLLFLISHVLFLSHTNEISKYKGKSIFQKGATSSSAYNFLTIIFKIAVVPKDQISVLKTTICA